MKKIIKSLLVVCMIGCSLVAFSQEKAEWPAIKTFHGIMGKVFHPTEENNFQPLRDSVSVLVEKAIEWKNSAVPAGYNEEVTKPTIAKLVKQCKSIQKAVKANKTNDQLKPMIIKAHDIFHEIMEKCKNE
ncbi:MAG: hypothetical protein WCJ85_08550 [Chitinophagaceae bacterium]